MFQLTRLQHMSPIHFIPLSTWPVLRHPNIDGGPKIIVQVPFTSNPHGGLIGCDPWPAGFEVTTPPPLAPAVPLSHLAQAAWFGGFELPALHPFDAATSGASPAAVTPFASQLFAVKIV